MRVLITGANGYIGSHLVAALFDAGHEVTCAVRDIKSIQLKFPQCKVITCDFNRDTDLAIWLPRLQAIDVVINSVGILQQRSKQSITAIHKAAPCALFAAAEKAGVKKIIQISALGIDASDVPFATTKKAADDFLMQLNIPWIILRPSLVYGAGSYGGTSMFRGLAALPFLTPVVGNGQQTFQPIHIHDLTKAINNLLEPNAASRVIINAVSTESISLQQLLIQLKQWLGSKAQRIWHVPLSLIRLTAKINDWFGNGPITSTALKMLLTSAKADPQAFIKYAGFTPRNFTQGLMTDPSQIQDRWHARLYFLRPLLCFSIGITWLLSGIIPLLVPLNTNLTLLSQLGLHGVFAAIIFYALVLIDIFLGLTTLMRWKINWVGSLQIICLLSYTLVLTIIMPGLWLQPFGPLLKNIPLLVAILIMLAIENDR